MDEQIDILYPDFKKWLVDKGYEVKRAKQVIIWWYEFLEVKPARSGK